MLKSMANGIRYVAKRTKGHVRRLASFVDGQMRHLAEGMNTTTPSKLAVLTALNLAHQLFELERKRAQGEADIERRMKSLMESIEEQVPTSLFRLDSTCKECSSLLSYLCVGML